MLRSRIILLLSLCFCLESKAIYEEYFKTSIGIPDSRISKVWRKDPRLDFFCSISKGKEHRCFSSELMVSFLRDNNSRNWANCYNRSMLSFEKINSIDLLFPVEVIQIYPAIGIGGVYVSEVADYGSWCLVNTKFDYFLFSLFF